MGAYSYSGTAASNTTIDSIGAAGSDTPDNIDNLIRTLAASDANTIKDLGGANTVGGTADAITVQLADVSTAAYADGMIFSFRPASDNATTTPTLNVDSLGAKAIKKTIQGSEVAVEIGDLQAGMTATVVYRSAWASAAGAFELLNPYNATAPMRGYIHGLTLSNNGSDATNDIDIAAGECTSDTAPYVRLTLGSTLTKRLDATWAVGTNQGGMDNGAAPTNTTYHIWLIRRSDTGVVDALFSTSATSPTMPTNYDQKRRIGSIMRVAGAIRLFYQYGDRFHYTAGVTDRSSTSGVTNTLLTLSVPVGVKVRPMLSFVSVGTESTLAHSVGDGDNSAAIAAVCGISDTSVGADYATSEAVMTNTSAQIRYTLLASGGTPSTATVATFGFIDTRGRDA